MLSQDPQLSVCARQKPHLSLLVSSQLKVFAPLNGQHPLGAAVGLHALQPQHNLLCGFSLRQEKRDIRNQNVSESDTKELSDVKKL